MREPTIMTMTSNKVVKILITSILITSINSTNTYAAGRNNSLPANTVLSGKGVPSTKIGINGDFYIDTRSLNFYGPKTKGKWPLPISLKGPAGPIGPSGVDGKNGVAGTSTSSSGAVGPAGATGATGSAGSIGATGATGATGPAGTGIGSVGPAGPKGETGTVGAVGPSNTQSSSITPWTLSTDTPNGVSESAAFGNLEAGKKYFYTIMVKGIGNSMLAKFRAGLELKSTDVSSIHNYEYSYAFALAHTAGANNTRLSFVVSGTISVANNSQFSIAISDGEGSSDSVSLSGKAFIQEVGAIN
jgi:hypothetical protein